MKFPVTIVILFAVLMAMGQKTVTITPKDIVIVGIQEIDTFYSLTSNPKAPYAWEKNIFDTYSKYRLYSDTLDLSYLKTVIKKNFFDEDCIFNRHMYIPCDYEDGMIKKIVLPEIANDSLRKFILKTYKEDGFNDIRRTHSESFIVNRHCVYDKLTYNTKYFLIVLMTAKKFSEEHNKIWNPPMYYFKDNINKQDTYLKFAIPIMIE